MARIKSSPIKRENKTRIAERMRNYMTKLAKEASMIAKIEKSLFVTSRHFKLAKRMLTNA